MYSFYLEGYQTYNRSTTNPYNWSTEEHHEWERGYADAFSDHLRDEYR